MNNGYILVLKNNPHYLVILVLYQIPKTINVHVALMDGEKIIQFNFNLGYLT